MEIAQHILEDIRKGFEGEVFTDKSSRLMYATDASAYREVPALVTRPKHTKDIHHLIEMATRHKLPLIPRTAGTSLAGQVVGDGIVADVSRHMTAVLELNVEERYVWVEPSVILDELNQKLAEHGLFFGPETSTASRCMIGGMVGNNSCGAHSLVYGSTRDHTLAIKAILSDGSEVEFADVTKGEFDAKCELETLEGAIYRQFNDLLSDPENQEQIRKEFPAMSLHRRNTGYAIDMLLETELFSEQEEKFNISKLIAGSEGTLAFITAIKLNLVDLPPKHKALVCVHLEDVPQAMHANKIALKHAPVSVELMDKAIMDLTRENREQDKNRFFVQGDPGSILIVEFAEHSMETIESKAKAMEAEMRRQGYGYHFPVVTGSDIKKVWTLRKAGLGLLSNMVGDAKPVAVIEDTAVDPEVLPEYIEEFDALLEREKMDCVYYAHIATGELHLRPILNLKDPVDVERFHMIALETAKLVKKYKGSLSGEHGDGRLRGEFIPMMIGEHNYGLIKQVKKLWDPLNIFNPNKIVDTPPMNTYLRYEPGKATKEIETIFDFSSTGGFLRAVEKCNGSGDCRKTHLSGGTMCPSYMATREEKNSTRARANILREFITYSESKNPFDSKEIYEVLDLCLSCKACKSECPSNIDMTKFKAEFLQHYYDKHGIPLRTRLIAYITSMNKMGMILPSVYNAFLKNPAFSTLLKKTIGFAPKRSMPTLYKMTLQSWVKRNAKPVNKGKKVFLFADEFTNYNDVEVGIDAVKLLQSLGYDVEIPKHVLSGRTFLSKGLLRKAKKYAITNVLALGDKVTEEVPIIGVEPSAILTFRDEYPELVGKDLQEKARLLGKNALLVDEFIAREFEAGRISKDMFTTKAASIKLHGHCQQKAVASTKSLHTILTIPENYEMSEIPSGCCGMAGSFGYEKEHYELSQAIGEMVLFPAVRNKKAEEIIAASGTSCRHQIKDGTGESALHPVQILKQALK